MIDIIDGSLFQRMVIHAAASIGAQKQSINELNVFPVPDGDTGTNMSLTIGTAATEARKKPSQSISQAAATNASALLRGARGNSGVILSLLFRGVSKGLKEHDTADGVVLAAALNEGVGAAYKAVMKPAEGTILTVSRLAAQRAVEAAQEQNSAEYVLEAAIAEGELALADTINQNPVLQKAGVVDAGGKGYLIILQGMLDELRGIPAPETGEDGAAQDKADFAHLGDEEITYTFDTVFIVRKRTPNVDLDPFRSYLNGIGDSLVIGEDDESFKVHVHTDIPGAALTEGQRYGTLELAKIENMRTQYEDMAAGRKPQSTDDLDMEESSAPEEPVVAPPEKKYGVVAVCAGAGMASVFRDLGVDGIISGGQTMNPSTEDILREISRTPAEIVFVLPNNKNIIMAAEQAEKLADRRVVVLPTRTIPMGITAMLNFDPTASVETNTINMMKAADNVSTGLITYAARDSEYDGKRIRKGEIMSLENGKIVATSNDLTKAAYRLARSMCRKDSSFVTVISGCDVSDEDAERTTEIIKAKCPSHVEVSHIRGGQPVYYYMISVE